MESFAKIQKRDTTRQIQDPLLRPLLVYWDLSNFPIFADFVIPWLFNHKASVSETRIEKRICVF